ncbi:MAG: phosphatidylglycerophosphatase A [Gammaproteobacteria bacterium]|nr:phosphatidylglycerophosphatase A [Gammaproteobacteria bacterium]
MSALVWRDGKNPEVLLVCGLGSGFLPKAPGTWGSVLGLAVWWWLLAPLPWLLQLAVAAATFAVGWWLVQRVTRRYECHDDPAIVIDEIVGIWIALLGIGESWMLAGLGFVLFRFLDIVKPWPIGVADRNVPGGLGVMLDDLIAGVLVAIVLHVSVFVFAQVF